MPCIPLPMRFKWKYGKEALPPETKPGPRPTSGARRTLRRAKAGKMTVPVVVAPPKAQPSGPQRTSKTYQGGDHPPRPSGHRVTCASSTCGVAVSRFRASAGLGQASRRNYRKRRAQANRPCRSWGRCSNCADAGHTGALPCSGRAGRRCRLTRGSGGGYEDGEHHQLRHQGQGEITRCHCW